MDFDEFDDVEIDLEESEDLNVITMIDDNNEPIDFVVIDGITVSDVQYLLVVEAADIDEDEPEATILKELPSADDDSEVVYEFVEDDDEYDKILMLLQDSDNDYELKI